MKKILGDCVKFFLLFFLFFGNLAFLAEAQTYPNFGLPFKEKIGKVLLVTQAGGLSADNTPISLPKDLPEGMTIDEYNAARIEAGVPENTDYFDPAHAPTQAYYALDFDVAEGNNAEVITAESGTVVNVKYGPNAEGDRYFPVTTVDHHNGYYTEYAEFKLDENFQKGYEINKGTRLGELTGAEKEHLHFQIKYGDPGMGCSKKDIPGLENVKVERIPLTEYKLKIDNNGIPQSTPVDEILSKNSNDSLFEIDSSTVALWRFNESNGNAVMDETGVNNGTALGVGAAIVDGKFGKARYFNGLTDYIVIPDSPSLNNFSQITIEAWVYPSGFDLGCWNQTQGLVIKGDNDDHFPSRPDTFNGFALWMSRNTDSSCGYASSFNQIRFSMQFLVGVGSAWHAPNQWYYVVGTYDGSNVQIYVNGVLQGSAISVSPVVANSRDLYINHCTWSNGGNSSQRMQGLIDEVRISNIARSAEEIAYYYNLATNQGVAKEPVIIVPGIMGSRLNRVSDNQEVWPNANLMWDSESDSYLDELKLLPSGNQIPGEEMYPSDICMEDTISTGNIPESITTNTFYKNLIDIFTQDGYIDKQNLFVVPYDWRLNISEEIDRLDVKIREAISNTPNGNGKVNIIAHSMGGLLVKEYFLQHPDRASSINKLIFVGVPQLGAPKAFGVLNYGDDMLDLKFRVKFLRLIEFKDIDVLNPQELLKISQYMPAIYQLLPSRRYIDLNNGGYIKDHTINGGQVLDYDQTKRFILDTPISGYPRNPDLINLAERFHSGLEDRAVIMPTIYNIVGCGNPTLVGFSIFNDGKSIQIFSGDGDGTVPLISALNANRLEDTTSINYFVFYSQTRIDHMGLVKDSRVIALIKNIINPPSFPPPLPTGIMQLQSLEDLYKPPYTSETSTIAFSIFCPAELHVYDSQNRHTGPLPNGDIELAIPFSRYDKMADNSFVFVPAGDTYRVVVKALSSGTFDLKTQLFNGIVLANTITYLAVPLQSNQTKAELDFSTLQGDLTLKLDSKGTGVVDSVLQPTAVLSDVESKDTTPPAITMPYIPPEVLLNTPLTFGFWANDDNSGVAFIKATLDGQEIADGAVIKMSKVGEHIVKIKAVDRAGNPKIEELKFNVVYNFCGFLRPIEVDGTGCYRQGRILPIRFQLRDVNNKFVSIATARLFIAKVVNNVVGTEEDAVSARHVNAGNKFRYDAGKHQYIFNLSTKTMSVGMWRLRVALDDGKNYMVNISLKEKSHRLLVAPSNLTAKAISKNQVNLRWQDNSEGEGGFCIERANGNSLVFSVIAKVDDDITIFNDKSLMHGKTYIYRVRAYYRDRYSESLLSKLAKTK